jgi:hypothetical protein
MVALSFGGQETLDHPDTSEPKIDRFHKSVTGGYQSRIKVRPV